MNSSKLCQSCPSAITGCSTCSSSTVCTSCDINHILVSPTSCLDCFAFIPQCLNCTTVSNQVQCLLCASGYYIDPLSYICRQCDTSVPQCVLCNGQFQCTACQQPLYYLKSPSKCETCQVALQYCLKCTNDGLKCNECLDDRYIL